MNGTPAEAVSAAWVAYEQAKARAELMWGRWREVMEAGGWGLMSGSAYSAAYQAEIAAEEAWAVWHAAYQSAVPSPRS